jgi:hypothetical protein
MDDGPAGGNFWSEPLEGDKLVVHTLPERSAKWNEGKDSGIAMSFGEGPLNKCTGMTILSDSRESSAYVAECFITGAIDWRRATLRLREPAS